MTVLVVLAPVAYNHQPVVLTLHCHLDARAERIAEVSERARIAQILGALHELHREAARRGFTTA